MNRRHFIRNLSLVSAALSSGLVSTLGNATTFDETIEKHTALFETAVKALLPTANYPVVQADSLPLITNIKQVIANLDAPLVEELSLGLSLFNNASYILGFHFKPFADMSPEQARDYIRSWEQGLQAQKVIAITIKKLVYIGYWGDPRSWPSFPSFDQITNRELPALGVTEFKG